MNFFIKEQSYRNFLKINFAFPHISIEKYKSFSNTSYINTDNYIPFIVNPKLIRYDYNSFDPEKKESILSTAHVYKTEVEEDAYYYVRNINDFFKKTTGEILFFRF